ncbi:MAG: hypothetical protein ABR520_10760 [Mycobacteriales bacterium]|nr:hypothetical protein [Frankia sp.]
MRRPDRFTNYVFLWLRWSLGFVFAALAFGGSGVELVAESLIGVAAAGVLAFVARRRAATLDAADSLPPWDCSWRLLSEPTTRWRQAFLVVEGKDVIVRPRFRSTRPSRFSDGEIVGSRRPSWLERLSVSGDTEILTLVGEFGTVDIAVLRAASEPVRNAIEALS